MIWTHFHLPAPSGAPGGPDLLSSTSSPFVVLNAKCLQVWTSSTSALAPAGTLDLNFYGPVRAQDILFLLLQDGGNPHSILRVLGSASLKVKKATAIPVVLPLPG